MRQPIFKGIATALITPFKGGEVDFEAFGRLIDWQIESGINGLVICGTSGCPSLPAPAATTPPTPSA